MSYIIFLNIKHVSLNPSQSGMMLSVSTDPERQHFRFCLLVMENSSAVLCLNVHAFITRVCHHCCAQYCHA